jgi:hypothetical protein
MPSGYIQFLLKTDLVLGGASEMARRYQAKAPFLLCHHFKDRPLPGGHKVSRR